MYPHHIPATLNDYVLSHGHLHPPNSFLPPPHARSDSNRTFIISESAARPKSMFSLGKSTRPCLLITTTPEGLFGSAFSARKPDYRHIPTPGVNCRNVVNETTRPRENLLRMGRECKSGGQDSD